MIIFEQDQNIVLRDTVRQKPDTSTQKLSVPSDSGRIVDSLPIRKVTFAADSETQLPVDTTSVCARNSISDVTFYDSANIVVRIDQTNPDRFPFLFIEQNKIRESEAKQTLLMHLKDGKEIAVKPFHDDWIIIVILASAFLYSIVSTFPGRLSREIKRFFLFRGIGDPSSRDMGELFHWRSTLFNLTSFLNLDLFTYCAAYYYDFIPSVISGIMFWLIASAIFAAAVTFRHIICFAAGRISGENKAFDEYIITFYLFYRFTAFIIFILTIIISYTTLLSPGLLFFTGFITIAILYLMRIIRLFLIFLNRSISILYLILYLCALEFLPVVVLLKYFTGLF